MNDPARAQIMEILSDGHPHEWCAIQRVVSVTHSIPQKAVSAILRELVAAGVIARANPDEQREPTVALASGGAA